MGIGVSMASAVCSFNLAEVCETTIALIKNPAHNALDTLKGPDFPGGGLLLWDEKELGEIYKTGRGSVKLRAKYNYDKEARCLEILEIPATTTIEAIKEKMIALIKAGKIKENKRYKRRNRHQWFKNRHRYQKKCRSRRSYAETI